MHLWILLASIIVFVFQLALSQPLYDIEKQFLYSFQDPDEWQMWPREVGKKLTVSKFDLSKNIQDFSSMRVQRPKRVPLLNLIGTNSRFTTPYRRKVKKIRSVRVEGNLKIHFYRFFRFLAPEFLSNAV